MVVVNAPDISDNPHPRKIPKKINPNSPYTIEGIPASVSVVRRTIPTNLLPRFAYSTRKIAAHMPSGTDSISDKPTIINVPTSAGNRD